MLADTPYRMIDGDVVNFKQYIANDNCENVGKEVGGDGVFSGWQCDGLHGGAVCIPRYSFCMRQKGRQASGSVT